LKGFPYEQVEFHRMIVNAEFDANRKIAGPHSASEKLFQINFLKFLSPMLIDVIRPEAMRHTQ